MRWAASGARSPMSIWNEDPIRRVLHHYVIPAKRAAQLCRVISGLSKKSLEKMRAVPKRRAEALPYGALVMEEIIDSFNLKEVVISAYGLREGVLHQSGKPASEPDPLVEFARGTPARGRARTPGHGARDCSAGCRRCSPKNRRWARRYPRSDLFLRRYRLAASSRR